MKIYLLNVLSVLSLLLMITSCNGNREEEQLREDVDSFAVNYFNWQFKKALPYCTDDSKVWIRYAASQVHQADIDLLKSQSEGIQYEINDIKYIGDSLAKVRITVRNLLEMDTIGTSGHIVEKRIYTLNVVHTGKEKWRIRMEGLPRGEKQSRD